MSGIRIEWDWTRLRLEPPIAGACQDPDCITVPLGLVDPLLVATYLEADQVERVCAACDERRLRAAVEADGGDELLESVLPAILEAERLGELELGLE